MLRFVLRLPRFHGSEICLGLHFRPVWLFLLVRTYDVLENVRLCFARIGTQALTQQSTQAVVILARRLAAAASRSSG